jgi:Tfp pilus assembly protein PilZ
VSTDEDMLIVRFESEQDFWRQYRRDIAKRGIFVPTDEPFALNQHVEVYLDLRYARTFHKLAGRVVNCVPPELAAAGARAGVAVQFELPAGQLRAKLESSFSAGVDWQLEDETDETPDRRRVPRSPTRIPARLRGRDGTQQTGRTRNLSRGGALLSLEGRPAAIGETVWLGIANPMSGEEREIEGRVARHLVGEGNCVVALAVEFRPDPDQAAELERFLEDLGAAEHNRRLGVISGPIEPLGLANLLQSFGQASPAGTMTVMCEAQEGFIAFEDGLVVAARLGRATGRKALTRMLSWASGSFEFHTQIDAERPRDEPWSLQAALLDAERMLDESRRPDAPRFAPEAILRTDLSVAEPISSDLGKLEATIADAAAAGVTVRELMDLASEPDPEIAEALAGLVERGVITLQ